MNLENYLDILAKANEDGLPAFQQALREIILLEKERKVFKKDPMMSYAWSTRGKV